MAVLLAAARPGQGLLLLGWPVLSAMLKRALCYFLAPPDVSPRVAGTTDSVCSPIPAGSITLPQVSVTLIELPPLIQIGKKHAHFCPCMSLQLPEVQFFGATTLHISISRHWSSLPSEQHESLRLQLLSHILRFSSGPKMVLTRLCIALAAMALNLIPQVWSQPVADMVRAFQPQEPECDGASGAAQDPQLHCLALLELLTVLPEELQSSRVAQPRRSQLREALAGEWGVVGSMLRQLLQSQDSSNQVKEKVLRCLSSWVGMDVPLGKSHELVQDCFSTLSNPEVFDTAVETIVTAISQPGCQR